MFFKRRSFYSKHIMRSDCGAQGHMPNPLYDDIIHNARPLHLVGLQLQGSGLEVLSQYC